MQQPKPSRRTDPHSAVGQPAHKSAGLPGILGGRRRSIAVRGAACCLLLLAAGCSPYQYSKEIADLSTGMDRLSNAFDAGYTSLAAEHAAERHRTLVDQRARVEIPGICGKPIPASGVRQPCALHAKQGPAPALTGVEEKRRAVLGKVKVLVAYVHALQAITNAADRTAFNDAAKRLGATVGELAAAQPGAGAIAPAAINLVLWVVGEKLDQDRFDALKQAVNEAQKPVEVVARQLGDALQAIKARRQETLSHTLRALSRPLGPALSTTSYRERLTEAETTLAKVDAVGQVDPTAATRALVEAHKALAKAVRDPEPNYAHLLAAISDFADKSKALYEVAVKNSK